MTDAIVVAPAVVDILAALARVTGAGPAFGVLSFASAAVPPANVGSVVVDTRDWRLWRFGVTCTGLVWLKLAFTGGFGGAAAIGTTPGLPPVVPVKLVGVVTADPECADPWTDCGDCELWSLPVFGVVAGVCCTEFFREAFFDALVAADPTGIVFPLPRFLFLMTSVFRDNGRTTPCNFKKRPHALHKGCPSGLRRHSGVVCVKQFVHVVGTPF
jgi:hypothetical protein